MVRGLVAVESVAVTDAQEPEVDVASKIMNDEGDVLVHLLLVGDDSRLRLGPVTFNEGRKLNG